MKTATRGILLALVTALISGISVYLNKYAVKAVPDPVVFTTLKNSLVGLALAGYLLAMWRRRTTGRPATERRATLLAPNASAGGDSRPYVALIAVALIGGSVPFVLFFKGLATASAPSAALIHKSLFLWVALLAVPLLGERPGRWALAGLGLLAFGQLLNGWPKAWGWGSGESLILLATLFWAAETIVVKRILPGVSTGLAAAARMAGGAIVMWIYLLVAGKADGALALTVAQWGWVALTSVFLLGYVTTWYAALQLAPATAVTSVLALGAVITTGVTLAVEGKAPGASGAVGLALMLTGVAVAAWAAARIGQREHVQPVEA